MHFRDPYLLLTVLLAPLVYFLMTRRFSSFATYSSLSLVRSAPRSIRTRLANLPALMLSLAVGAMAIALAGPQTPDDQTRIRHEGIAVVMVVDRSGSMQARDMVKDDVSINRLDVVKKLFNQFVLGGSAGKNGRSDLKGRPDDVIGLVAFARYADGLCPLTLDHGNLVTILDDLQIVTERSEDGTALGEGLALAVERLRNHPARAKVVIILTDGVTNAGDVQPKQAAELARVHDIKVYSIGVGTRGQALYPISDPFTGRTVFRARPVEIDEETLKDLAQITGGEYFRATDQAGLAEIYAQIDRLERTEISEIRYLQFHERYGVMAWCALALLAAGNFLAGSFFRRLP